MRYAIFTIALVALSVGLRAQELPVFEQYLQNTYLLSPAAVGIKPCTEFILTDRHQWTGMESAPNNQSLGAYTRFTPFQDRPTYGHDGIGGNIYTDRNGPTGTTRFQFLYAHHLKIYSNKRKHQVWHTSFGLGLTGYQHRLDETDLLPENLSDPIYTGTSNSVTAFNLDGGVLFYTKKLTVGFTAANVLPSSKSDFGNVFNRNYFGFVGYTSRNKDGMGFSPSAVFKLYGKQKQIDLNAKMFFNDVFHAGLAYRHNLDQGLGQSLYAMLFMGLEFERFSFGYAYDYSIRKIGRYNYGSHSLMVGYKICKRDINCPAFM